MTLIYYFNEYYNTECESEHSVTLGGLVIEKFGRIPEESESVTIDNFLISVQKVTDHRILELLVKALPPVLDSEIQQNQPDE